MQPEGRKVHRTPGIEIRQIVDSGLLRERLLSDVREGLGRRPRSLPPKYFYDARGSRLFEEITRLPEYYLTRAERSILERIAPSLIRTVRPSSLVEFGSGSSGKTEILFKAAAAEGGIRGYASIDVSFEAVSGAAERLRRLYPDLQVAGIVDDFQHDIALPFSDSRRLVLFLGSTIGNLRPAEAVAFARSVSGRLAHGDAFLIGFDLVKDREQLVAAYDDSRGVTAAFNRNVLHVLNRELDADFVPDAFRHQAVWNEEASRIEMRLVAERAQTVSIPALDMGLTFTAGESICTELSHKYTRETATRLLEEGGFRVERWETDATPQFAVAIARVA